MEKKGRTNRKYSAEFKIGVIIDMREHHLGYEETVRKYWPDITGSDGHNHTSSLYLRARISLEEGAEGFMTERRGRACGPDKGRPPGATPQMREFQQMLKDHNITQSMSGKGNCLDNSVMENFFGRLKTEMFFGEQFKSVDDFKQKLDEYICYFNNDRISLKLKGMSPVQYRTRSMRQ